MFYVGQLIYFVFVIALCLATSQGLFLLLLLFLLNAATVFCVGQKAIRALLFPYSLWLIKDGVSRQNNSRYAEDFSNLMAKAYLMLRYHHSVDGKSMGHSNPAVQTKIALGQNQQVGKKGPLEFVKNK
jgi:hypothetical protein